MAPGRPGHLRWAAQRPSRPPHREADVVEFLNYLIILLAAWLLWRRPERERLAFGLLALSAAIMAALFLIGTHTSLLPRVNL